MLFWAIFNISGKKNADLEAFTMPTANNMEAWGCYVAARNLRQALYSIINENKCLDGFYGPNVSQNTLGSIFAGITL